MSTMTISVPDSLKSFVDGQVAARGYGTGAEYVHELIRKDRDRERLRQLLLEGAASAPASEADAAYFDGLRAHSPARAQVKRKSAVLRSPADRDTQEGIDMCKANR